MSSGLTIEGPSCFLFSVGSYAHKMLESIKYAASIEENLAFILMLTIYICAQRNSIHKYSKLF